MIDHLVHKRAEFPGGFLKCTSSQNSNIGIMLNSIKRQKWESEEIWRTPAEKKRYEEVWTGKLSRNNK